MRWGRVASFLVLVAAVAALLVPAPSVLDMASSARAGDTASAFAADRKPRITLVFAGVGSEATSLVVGGALDTGGLETTYHVEYGLSTKYGLRTPSATLAARPQPGTGYPTTGAFRAIVSDLQPARRYHYRIVASNGLGMIASPNRTIVSGGKAPLISDAYIRNARQQTSIVLGATVDTRGLLTTTRVECGPSYAVKTADVVLPAVPSPASWAPTKREVRFVLDELAEGKRYLCRIVAFNEAGSTAYERDFVSAKHPHGVEFPAVGVGPTASSVVVSAMVDTSGLKTAYYVEYGRTLKRALRTRTRTLPPKPGRGWSPTTTEIRVPLLALEPAATYHFRVVAVNAKGTDSVARSFVSDGSKPAISYQFASPGSGYYSAVFGAAIDTGGLPTSYHVEYGPSLQYGAQTATRMLPARPSPDSYRPTIIETTSEEVVLGQGATVHYRVVATNAVGRTNSSDRTFVVG
jgi:hypothetical protein